MHVGLARSKSAGGAPRLGGPSTEAILRVFFRNLDMVFPKYISLLCEWLEPHKFLVC
jgi:hypothetical protein